MSKILNLGKASTETKTNLVGSFSFDGDVDPTGKLLKQAPIPDTTCYTNDPGSGSEVAVPENIY